jgi:bifunctional UDP-N-acetylglucosamine pyrophosphorylase/glucosamine-1-phosphate N-acetyltransferase
MTAQQDASASPGPRSTPLGVDAPQLSGTTAVVLAAGKGSRMRSRQHKVLHRLAGKSMVWHVLTALQALGLPPARTLVVVGDGADEVRGEIEREFGAGSYPFVLQQPRLGTGHAVQIARPYVPGDTRTVVVAYGDTPLLRPETIARLVVTHEESGSPLTLVTGRLEDPSGYGRIVRDLGGALVQIVEERDATVPQKTLREVNSGFCAFDAEWLWAHLPSVQPARNGEIYLTALAGLASSSGAPVATLALEDIFETTGVNTRQQLAEAERVLRGRLVSKLMAGGVTIQDPSTTYVDADVEVGSDTTIYANTHLAAGSRIGQECDIGPNAIIRRSEVADRCRIVASVLDGATLEEEVTVGPFAHLRPGTHCGRAVEIGTGSELKASYLGAGTRMHHFGYLGDATVGANVNVGAGSITCNFDGEQKHPTRVGDDAFVGSGTLLVAPVTVGRAALTGAGAVVLRDVPERAKVVGVPARQIGTRL